MKSKQYDVVVVGGGVAGVAAAIQAARCGAKTALIEKTVFPGGLATSGVVFVYLPLCDGFGRQVIFGISEELLHRSIKYGPGEVDPAWRNSTVANPGKRYMCDFSPAACVLALDEILTAHKVDVWYDTLFCAVDTGSDFRTAAIEVENKSGRIRIEAKCFVDASGDCDLVRRAGGEVYTEDNWTSMWAVNYHAGHKTTRHTLAPALELFVLNDRQKLHRGITGRSVTEMVLETRCRMREFFQREYAGDPLRRKDFFAMLLPSMADFRKTFAVKGKITLDETNADTVFPDSIGIVGDWRGAGNIREIPYGALLPEQLRGVVCVGRCISNTGDAWEQFRCIPQAAFTGQAGGMAAALAVNDGIPPDQLSVAELQKALTGEGILLHASELPPLR